MSGVSFLEVVEEILQEMPKKEGHVNQISEIAISKNKNMGLDYETLKSKIMGALNSTVKRKSGSKFSRVPTKAGTASRGPYRKGIYRLKRSRNTQPLAPTQATQDKAFLGKGGEYAVASELMFRDFNVSLMVVDKGVDLVAEKHNKYFNIQVKTASENNGAWGFTIKKDSFVSSLGGQTHYVFVARQERANVFFILPSIQIKSFLDTGVLNENKTTISPKIIRADSGKKWFLNNVDITYTMGAFDIIQ